MALHYKICVKTAEHLLESVILLLMLILLPVNAETESSHKSISDSLERGAFQEYEVDTPPECINIYEIQKTFVYPDSALKSGTEGKVTVKILIDKIGNVLKIGEMTGTEIFFKEVKQKVVKLRFIPGIYHGEIVKVWVKVPLYFKIAD